MKFNWCIGVVVWCFAANFANANDVNKLKAAIAGENRIKAGEKIELNIPIITKNSGKQQLCVVQYDSKSGKMSSEKCCRDITSDDPRKYIVKEGSGQHNHCFPNPPGKCQNYHGVGQNACNIYTSGALSYVWCPDQAQNPTTYSAEVYYGAAGLLHVGNISSIAAGACPGP